MSDISASHLGWTSLLVVGVGSLAHGQTTERVNVDSNGAQANNESGSPSFAASGQYVVFSSRATNLVAGDTNGVEDAFLHDRLTGVTERLDVDAAGNQADQRCAPSWVSPDGRFVALGGPATNLVPGDTNGAFDVFIRDRLLGTIERDSVDSNGIEANGSSASGSGTPDGRYVVFSSLATNLVAGDTNGMEDVFLHDRLTGTTERISVNTAGVQGNYGSFLPSISDDGRYVAFTSYATNLAPATFNAVRNSFVRDRTLGTTVRVNLSTAGAEANGDTIGCAISGNGSFVVFDSLATNLVTGDTNAHIDVFVRNMASQVTERVSLATGGAQLANGGSQSIDNGICSAISADGRFVVFHSSSQDAVPGKTTFYLDCYLRDRLTGTTERVSVTATAGEANGNSFQSTISSDGRYVAFLSSATNLVAGDTNGYADMFVRDRGVQPLPVLYCAGDGTAGACPCANSGATGRGCQNSASSGGAMLIATGSASLAADTLGVSSSGELPQALSIYIQGDSAIAAIAFGDGRRCVGGSLRRMYVLNAVGGVVGAPPSGAPSFSARSASLGDVIGAGTARYYQVYYADPSATYCPAPTGGTMNVSNALSVLWGN